MPTSHCISTTDGTILDFDRSFVELVARPRDALVGSSYRTITHPDDLQESARMLRSLIAVDESQRIKKRYLRPDGSSVKAELLVTKFLDPDRLVSTLLWSEPKQSPSPREFWEIARSLRRLREVGTRELGADLVTEGPASILVGIYLAEMEGDIAAANSLARMIGLAPNVASRWIAALEQRGLVERCGQELDVVQLTHEGARRLERMLSSLLQRPTTS